MLGWLQDNYCCYFHKKNSTEGPVISACGCRGHCCSLSVKVTQCCFKYFMLTIIYTFTDWPHCVANVLVSVKQLLDSVSDRFYYNCFINIITTVCIVLSSFTFLNWSCLNILLGIVPCKRHWISFFMNIPHNNLPVIWTWPCGCIFALFQIRAEVQPPNRPAAVAVC